MFNKVLAVSLSVVLLSSFSIASAQSTSMQKAVDANISRIEGAVQKAGLTEVASIDHARLALAEGVEMPASRVLIFSDSKINTDILSESIRAGLDLPFRALSFDESGVATVAYTDADFLRIRHGLQDVSTLRTYNSLQESLYTGLPTKPAPTISLAENYGILELRSELSVAEAVNRLTQTVKSQTDTVWFGEIDFSKEAAQHGKEIDEAVLLLFGGPAPGGVAMADFPAIGLDAFCQKLLVYADENGGSITIFNDIAALAQLHYGQAAKPHHALNERLTATFKEALRQ